MKMVSLLKFVTKQPYLNMFKKKKNNNKGVLWASLISFGVSTLMMMLRKGKGDKITSSFQSLAKNMKAKSSIPMLNKNAVTEFAEELNGRNVPAKSAGSKQNTPKSHEFSNELLPKNIPSSGEISAMDDATLNEFSEEVLSKTIENN